MGLGKRRNSRLHLHLDCLHEQFKAQIKDVSVSGIQFISRKRLEKHTITELDIIAPKDDLNIDPVGQARDFKLKVEVMWCKKGHAGEYTVGAKIITSSDKTEKLFLAYLLNNSSGEFAHMDQKLLEMEAYQTLVMNATYPIVVVQDEKIVFINPACTQVMGYEQEEAVGKIFVDCLFHEDQKNFKTIIVNQLSAKNKSPYIISLIRKDGVHVDVEARSKGIQYRDAAAVMYILRDVTEVKKLEKQLLRAEKLKALGEITGGVAHNFNNILGVILGRSQLLQCNLDKPDVLKKGLNIIEKAAQDGSEITKRLQDSIRVRKTRFGLSRVDINEIIREAIDFTRTKWKDEAQAKGIAISMKTSLAQLPRVIGNESELREVFVNLVLNAIDAMPMGGRIFIKTVVSGGYISVTFSDSGKGMSEEVRARVFDPFFTTKGQQGTGLGMSLSYNIVSRHKGDIHVESIDGEGATFTIFLPIPSETEKSEIEEAVLPVQDTLEVGNILIVDDDEDIRDVLVDLLTHFNHNVSQASNGREALELFNAGSYDMVITDLSMPEMSGLGLASSIKAIDPATPVILLTGWNPQAEDEPVQHGDVDFEVAKPCDLNEVLSTVSEAMRLKMEPYR